jgi:hypothetical protein
VDSLRKKNTQEDEKGERERKDENVGEKDEGFDRTFEIYNGCNYNGCIYNGCLYKQMD